MAPLPSSESPGLGHVAVPQTETMVASSGDSSLSGAVSSSAEASELCSASQNLLAVAESENGQVMDKTVKENAAGGDGFSWMDYLGTENTENTVGADDSTCMDYCEPGAIADENDLISQNNDISLFQDSEDKDMVLNEDLAESSEVSLLEGESNQEPHGSSGNLQEEELPLLVQDSQVLLLPYKEESTRNEESVRENEASSSNVGHGQEEVEFDGFGDMFNEPEVVVGPGIGPSLANDVAETGFLAGSISDSDPNEVDDSDSPVSVESCLAHFIKLELLTDDNAWDCENCAKILQRQKLEAKKKQAKKSKNLTNGGELCNEGKSEIEEASLMKSNSSVSSKFHGQEEESGRIQPVDSSNAENHSGYDIPQQSNSQMSENHQSGESEDEEIDSENVKVKRNATKRYLINKAPPILTIHLKRFSQDARGRLSKLNGHVNFRETIDLRPYVDTRCEDRDNCIYHLAGVVEHSGTMRGGHYIAYVKGGEKRKGKAETENISSSWYYVSDHYVRQVSLEEVLRLTRGGNVSDDIPQRREAEDT
ncbi:Peptidase C19, ubiquitin carboxyl-terminal hydrolase 2 [Corchorus olitorius]|uniref:Peptidase C19, ubiquitin carboxyl-terminal hydrolase 2 n=1 Tax=Corchorus olitorius TaxID=93759 RepID=A0A1R3J1H8_9ROSI|nr:Peptidase C19, ubiquitin carboxyl-terminal hydrolase 2 [Corchorus olitorius]